MSARTASAAVPVRAGVQPVLRYPPAMRAMHWATVALLPAVYAIAWAIEDAATAAQAGWLLMLHRSLGLTVLLLTALRLAWRQHAAVPALPDGIRPAQRVAARASVVALYAVLVLQPLLGLAGSMLHGDHVVVFGSLEVPTVLPVGRPLARRAFAVHGGAAVLLLVLIGAHVAAALHHGLVRRDRVLAGMLPWPRPRKALEWGSGRP